MRTVAGMVTMLALGTVLSAASGPSLPSGGFRGTASWHGPGGSSGTYTVDRAFQGNAMSARYTWVDEKQEPREEQHTVTFVPGSADPVFDVVDGQGQVVGQGHCLDDACSYRAVFGPLTIDESFRWSADGMTVLGAKSGPGFSVVWHETLELR